MKKIILITILLSTTLNLFAQKITLKGTVRSTNETLPMVTISIYNSTSNKIIEYTTSNENGFYILTFEKCNFYIKASMLGYTSFTSSEISSEEKEIKFDIEMKESIEELNEISVLSKKRLIRLSGDKMIIEVEKSGLGEGNDGLETLSQLPGIRLDKDENILFRGNGDLQIMIDGKPTILTNEALKQFLKSISGNNIKEVEIIANPSAKYDATGTGGILNIKLKKEIEIGLLGNVFSAVGYGDFIKVSNGINLYKNSKNWNFNGGIYQSYGVSVNNRRIIRTFDDGITTNILDQFNDWFPTSKSYSAKIGLERTLSKNSNLGTNWNYSIYNSDANTIGRTNQTINNVYTNFATLNINQIDRHKTLTGNVYYKYQSDSLDTKLDIQANFANYNNRDRNITTNQFFDAQTNQQNKLEEVVKNQNPTDVIVFNIRGDFEQKINKNLSFETGLKYSFVNNEYTILIEEKNQNDNFIKNEKRSNELIYKESIAAFYGIVNYNLKKWNFQAGFRGEYIDYTAKSLTDVSENSGDYISYFPSFSINNSQENNQYKLSYSRRIRRPRYRDLNPFFEYIDTYNIRVGNPNLQPQFTNAFELTWVSKNRNSLSFYTNFTSDDIFSVMTYNPLTEITTMFQDNIASSVNYGFSYNRSVDVKKWWEMQLYADYSFNSVQSNVQDFVFDNSGDSWYASLNQTFRFENKLTATWNSFYSAGGVYGNSKSLPSYDMSFSVRKYFLDDKLSVRFSATNVFKTAIYRAITTQENNTTDWTNKWETRIFRLSLSYNFGKGKKKEIKETNIGDERSRI